MHEVQPTGHALLASTSNHSTLNALTRCVHTTLLPRVPALHTSARMHVPQGIQITHQGPGVACSYASALLGQLDLCSCGKPMLS